ncbi:wd repeat protein [Moniliophthora roreri]|nr:wd repeat protein [Moniliophthora roreri]
MISSPSATGPLPSSPPVKQGGRFLFLGGADREGHLVDLRTSHLIRARAKSTERSALIQPTLFLAKLAHVRGILHAERMGPGSWCLARSSFACLLMRYDAWHGISKGGL